MSCHNLQSWAFAVFFLGGGGRQPLKEKTASAQLGLTWCHANFLFKNQGSVLHHRLHHSGVVAPLAPPRLRPAREPQVHVRHREEVHRGQQGLCQGGP